MWSNDAFRDLYEIKKTNDCVSYEGKLIFYFLGLKHVFPLFFKLV